MLDPMLTSSASSSQSPSRDGNLLSHRNDDQKSLLQQYLDMIEDDADDVDLFASSPEDIRGPIDDVHASRAARSETQERRELRQVHTTSSKEYPDVDVKQDNAGLGLHNVYKDGIGLVESREQRLPLNNLRDDENPLDGRSSNQDGGADKDALVKADESIPGEDSKTGSVPQIGRVSVEREESCGSSPNAGVTSNSPQEQSSQFGNLLQSETHSRSSQQHTGGTPYSTSSGNQATLPEKAGLTPCPQPTKPSLTPSPSNLRSKDTKSRNNLQSVPNHSKENPPAASSSILQPIPRPSPRPRSNPRIADDGKLADQRVPGTDRNVERGCATSRQSDASCNIRDGNPRPSAFDRSSHSTGHTTTSATHGGELSSGRLGSVDPLGTSPTTGQCDPSAGRPSLRGNTSRPSCSEASGVDRLCSLLRFVVDSTQNHQRSKPELVDCIHRINAYCSLLADRLDPKPVPTGPVVLPQDPKGLPPHFPSDSEVVQAEPLKIQDLSGQNARLPALLHQAIILIRSPVKPDQDSKASNQTTPPPKDSPSTAHQSNASHPLFTTEALASELRRTSQDHAVAPNVKGSRASRGAYRHSPYPPVSSTPSSEQISVLSRVRSPHQTSAQLIDKETLPSTRSGTSQAATITPSNSQSSPFPAPIASFSVHPHTPAPMDQNLNTTCPTNDADNVIFMLQNQAAAYHQAWSLERSNNVAMTNALDHYRNIATFWTETKDAQTGRTKAQDLDYFGRVAAKWTRNKDPKSGKTKEQELGHLKSILGMWMVKSRVTGRTKGEQLTVENQNLLVSVHNLKKQAAYLDKERKSLLEKLEQSRLREQAYQRTAQTWRKRSDSLSHLQQPVQPVLPTPSTTQAVEPTTLSSVETSRDRSDTSKAVNVPSTRDRNSTISSAGIDLTTPPPPERSAPTLKRKRSYWWLDKMGVSNHMAKKPKPTPYRPPPPATSPDRELGHSTSVGAEKDITAVVTAEEDDVEYNELRALLEAELDAA